MPAPSQKAREYAGIDTPEAYDRFTLPLREALREAIEVQRDWDSRLFEETIKSGSAVLALYTPEEEKG